MALCAAVLWCFAPVLAGGFVWDDEFNLLGNRNLRGFGSAELRWMATSVHLGHYHPLTWLSLALDERLHGPAPWGFHLSNLLLHAANALLVYALGWTVLARAGLPGAALAAGLAAALFALHPLRVESVAWVTERRGLLAAAWSLACVLAYVRSCDGAAVRRGWRAASLGAFALALLSKGSSMSLPVVLVLLDWHPLGRAARCGWRRIVGEKWAYWLLAAAAAVQAARAASASGAMTPVGEHGIGARVVQAAYGAGFYVRQALWPDRLSPLYPMAGFDPGAPGVLALAGAAGAITLAVVAWRRCRPAWLLAWGAYLALLAPTLGLAQSGLQVAADRYTYAAMIPFAVLAAAGVQALLARRHALGWIVAAALAVVCAGLAAATREQIPVWRDTAALWGRVAALHPASPDAWHNLGMSRAARDPHGALADLDRAIALAPEQPLPYNSRATLREALRDLAGARADLDRAIALAPVWADPYNNRGNVRLAAGDVAGALEDYDRALALSPDHVRARYNRAVARERQRDVAGALADMDAAIRLAPDWAHAYAMRVRYRAALNDTAGALADCERALALLPPGSADARTVEGYRATLLARPPSS